jgi:hypothetical protein
MVSIPASGSIRRPLPALIAALAAVAAYLALVALQIFVSVLYDWASGRFEDSLSQVFSASFLTLQQDIPVAIALLVVSFLAFWGILPVHGALRFGQALARGVVAAVIVGVVTGIVVTVQYLAIVRNLSFAAGTGLGADSILRSMAEATDNSATYFAQTAPLVVLGALILWNWTRSHPVGRMSVVTDPSEPTLV